MKRDRIPWGFYQKCALYATIGLIGIHLFLYVGESIQRKLDPSIKFVERLFDIWRKIVAGNCYFSPVIMPKYSVRIIYTFSFMLFLGFYFALKARKKWLTRLLSAATMLALLTTGTRTLILAPFVGIIVCFLGSFVRNVDKRIRKQQLHNIIFLIGITVIFDFVCFDGRMGTRFKSSFQVSEEVLENGEMHEIVYDDITYTKEKEVAGTVNSNTTRILQLRDIIEKFKKRPLFGYGYGNLGVGGENELAYFDLQAPTLLIQTGIAGVMIWFGYLFFLFGHVLIQIKRGRFKCLAFLFIIGAVSFCSLLCYVLQSMTMLMILFCFLDYKYIVEKSKLIGEEVEYG
ncbi:O-antigen ligase family protein [Anaerosporobacter faecicola]|uniref:O-antigen ligase family protein n=1 Tax=Anaerosporobacter faecicola TaxID=2718714 RepID=UPI0014391FE3|nr:O-antigen ligase family protein [Anaerosporobacter faecicola]